MNKLFSNQKHAIFIDGRTHLIPSAIAYVSRTGRSIAVVLHGPVYNHPKFGRMSLVKPHRVYLSLNECQYATEPIHLLNAASHKARSWLDIARAEIWHHMAIEACRPLREKCKPMLQAISTWCRNTYGNQYWRKPEGRAALASELSRMGICLPESLTVIDFMPLCEVNEATTGTTQ